jgi:hypothetical protein
MVECLNDQEIAFINQSPNYLVLNCVEVFFSSAQLYRERERVLLKLILIFSQVVLKYANVLY